MPEEYTRFKFPSCHFNDGVRKIDYVIAYQPINLLGSHEYNIVQKLLRVLEINGLEIERAEGLTEDVTFEKIHVPNKQVPKLAEQHNVELMCNNPYFKNERNLLIKWFGSVLTRVDQENPIFTRARATLSGEKPKEATDAERIMIVHKLIWSIEFEMSGQVFDISTLLDKHIIKAAYPIHDTTAKWTNEGELSDRQLLARYWVSLKAMIKDQPLNLIQNYFGPEVAFYFAWIGFYTQMLVYAAILNIICIIFAAIYFLSGVFYVSDEVCKSNLVLCPMCKQEEYCPFFRLRTYCFRTWIERIFDNPITVVNMIFMSFWGVLFIVYWKRKEAMFRLRWNLIAAQVNRTMRPEFKEANPDERKSSITNSIEYYFRTSKRCGRYFLSYSILALLFISFILFGIGTFFMRKLMVFIGKRSPSPFIRTHIYAIEGFAYSFSLSFIMLLFEYFYCPLSKKLSDMELPRTEIQFENTYLVKMFMVAFATRYFILIYYAFLKGQFYRYPGSKDDYFAFGNMEHDFCEPGGCLPTVNYLLWLVLLMDFLKKQIPFLITKPFSTLYEKYMENKNRNTKLPRWEEDYKLTQLKPNHLATWYTTTVIEYGFVICFIAALPILPIIVLIKNIFEMRKNAHTMLMESRRYVPKQVPDIGAWKTVIKFLTLLAVFTNPLILAMHSRMIPKLIYYHEHGHIEGFIKSRYSEFPIKSIELEPDSQYRNVSICYYPGLRYPPSSRKRYQLTEQYWHEMTVKSFFLIIMENLILLMYLFLLRVIPEVPRKVKVRLEYEQRLLKQYRNMRNQ